MNKKIVDKYGDNIYYGTYMESFSYMYQNTTKLNTYATKRTTMEDYSSTDGGRSHYYITFSEPGVSYDLNGIRLSGYLYPEPYFTDIKNFAGTKNLYFDSLFIKREIGDAFK